MKKLRFGYILVLTTVFMGCGSPTNPRKTAPPETHQSTKETADRPEISLDPQMDILFVIDNSDSMGKHQVNLSNNIDRFVDAFAKNSNIDFHIGVVSVFDSNRFGYGPNQVSQFYPKGQLRLLRNPLVMDKADGQYFVLDRAPYITRDTPDYKDVLAETLKIGVHPLKEGGPEREESFSPVLEIISNQELNNNFNSGFLRRSHPQQAHLVLIFITDANDSSPEISADILDTSLSDSGYTRDNLSVIGVISPTDSNCHKDPGGNPTKIEAFLSRVDGEKIDMCTDYGDRLAKIGADLRVKVSERVIALKHRPQTFSSSVGATGDKVASTFTVSLDYEEVPGEKSLDRELIRGKEWVYNVRTNTVRVFGDLHIEESRKAKISVEYTPVKLENILNGRARSAL